MTNNVQWNLPSQDLHPKDDSMIGALVQAPKEIAMSFHCNTPTYNIIEVLLKELFLHKLAMLGEENGASISRTSSELSLFNPL